MVTNAAKLPPGYPECSSRQVLDLLGSRWSMLIIIKLAAGTRRFTELRQEVSGITPKVLTSNLRDLERDGLLTRQVYAEVPPRAQYQLTPLGESLIGIYNAIRDWSDQNLDEVSRNRDAYDRRRSAAQSGV
ncbi:winged helix-turn-helix transcriptional regulator [Streptosporangium sp. KLBMP 9127]|nr:helix-turn-helix transcriptional regulator [Streptosporangium sp. KLBMP 9127]